MTAVITHNIVVHTALAFFTAISLIVLLRNTALRMGLVDYPGGRKQHEGAVPVVGGIAIYGAFAFSALLVTQSEPLYPFRSLLGGMGLLVFAGVLDDMHDLSPLSKLAMQCAAALLMVSWGGVYVTQLGDLFGLGGKFLLGNFAIPFTLVCVLGVINALNMTDGVDGLAGGLSLISLAALAVISFDLKLTANFLMICILIGAVVGFLCFNVRNPLRRRAGVFLGDAGSMALGFAMCWFAVSLGRVQDAVVPPIALVWLIAVPLLDMGVVMLRRLFSGRSPFAADREHLHHILLRRGLSDTATTSILLVAAVITAAVGLAIWKYRIPEALGFYGIIAIGIVLTASVHVASLRLARKAQHTSATPGSDAEAGNDAQVGSVVLFNEVEPREIRKR
jgi:UDP-GlcNAc:undecaprenyl-phosphate GlcNAc-1-phosphate transferase